eukprot:Nitzschia sp. Nitz4//scaffold5_size260463//192881//194082//NITZ4_001007-RA/size260463-augustus-gene-0.18-mRNA-1//1//CDS//3329555415//1946//frame0
MSDNNTEVPSEANAGCVGPSAQDAGKSSACEGCPNQSACASGAFNTPEAIAAAQRQAQQLQQSLANVSHVVLVLSGKGGVGKSTVASQLAHTLAHQGYAVGLLDVDLCGPSAPRMILGDGHASSKVAKTAAGSWVPVYHPNKPNLACMSISFLLPDPNAAVVWRGPRKNALIEQFLTQVDWTGDTEGLDYLVVDTPPGTSDEHISTVQFLQKAGNVSGAVVVTTPEEISMADVRKELNFCQKTKLPVLGIVENMGQYNTPLSKLQFHHPETGDDCTQDIMQKLQQAYPDWNLDAMMVSTDLFVPPSTNSPQAMAQQYQVPYWGKVPMDPDLLKACEGGTTFVEDQPTRKAAEAFRHFAKQLISQLPVEEAS